MSFFVGDSLMSVFEGSLDVYPVTLVLRRLFSANYNRTVAVSLLFFSPLETVRFARFEMDVKLRMEKELEQLQQEMNELQKLSEQLPHDINQLVEQLVEKDQQLSDAIKKRQRRSIAHTEAIKQLSVTGVALEESRQKLEALQLNLHKKLEEQDTILQTQLEQTKDRFKSQLSEEGRRHQRALSEREESTQRQQESFRKQLWELSVLWQARTRQSAEKQRELQEKIQQKMEDKKDEEVSKQKLLTNKRESSSGLCGNGRPEEGQ